MKVATGALGASSSRDTARCFHCGEANPAGVNWHCVVDGAEARFCCAGCLAVAQTIRAAGLGAFYALRDSAAGRIPHDEEEWTREAVAADAAGLVAQLGGDLREVSLLLEGLHCGACVWLTETWLARQRGVDTVSVNLATRRARVRYDAAATTLAKVLQAVAGIGYRAHPYDPRRREAMARRESRRLLTRMAIALLAMMQVMMFAVPAYVSREGVAPEHQALLNWASLVLTLPVLLYSAIPFFAGALRDLRLRRPGMDVPIALGIGAAFIASVRATILGSGAVYFDSVTMFVALVLVARYLDLRARESAGNAIEAVARDQPQTAERLDAFPGTGVAATMLAARLRPGDFVRVIAGSAVPADGEVVEGRSSVEEAVLTGESWPRLKQRGDQVMAGSVNRESPLIVRVTAAGEATTLSALARLVERAAAARPHIARLADRVAGWFVLGLLVVAAASAVIWWQLDASRAFVVVLAVLVISCPCALSLATPAALAAAAGTLARRRILIVRPDAQETLSQVTHAVLDKTGTLTTGDVRLLDTLPLAALDAPSCIAIAAALDQGLTHPIAIALRAHADPRCVADAMVASTGDGVEGTIAGRRYRLGRPAWVAQIRRPALQLPLVESPAGATAVALADDSGWLALMSFGDTLRPGAAEFVATLRDMGIAVSLVSGDRAGAVAPVADALGITEWHADARPDDKRAFIARSQQAGAIVAMIGDGINDAPALAQANVSLALGNAAALAQWSADVVVLGDNLAGVAQAIRVARRTFRVIRQNLAWALLYNVVAIPMAATGHLSPLVAALGMSTSSLVVVANAWRLAR